MHHPLFLQNNKNTSISNKISSCTMQEQILREAEEDNEEKKDDIQSIAKEDTADKNEINPETENAKAQKSRKLLSSCTAIEPWLLEQFPLDPRDVVIAHVVHKSTMLPHFQIRLTSGASFDGKTLSFQFSMLYCSALSSCIVVL